MGVASWTNQALEIKNRGNNTINEMKGSVHHISLKMLFSKDHYQADGGVVTQIDLTGLTNGLWLWQAAHGNISWNLLRKSTDQQAKHLKVS